MFNLDSTSNRTDIEDETDIKEKWARIKIIVGSAIGCITVLMLFIVVILHLRRRYSRLEQKVEDEVEPLR